MTPGVFKKVTPGVIRFTRNFDHRTKTDTGKQVIKIIKVLR